MLCLLSVLLATCGGAASTPASTDLPAAASNTASQPTDTSAAPTAAQTTVSFSQAVLPILQSRCVSCHGGTSTQKGLVLNSFAGVMAGSQNGAVIVAGDPADSTLLQLAVAGKMPKRGPKLTPDQLQIISDWITAGAPNN